MSDVKSQVKEIVAEILEMNADDVGDDLGAEACSGWDSANHVTINMAIEDKFDIALDEDDFQKTRTVGELVKLVESKVR